MQRRLIVLIALLPLIACGSSNTPTTPTAVTLKSIAVTCGSGTLTSGTGVACKATGTMSDNSTMDHTSSATWSSSSTLVATITSAGVVTAVSRGTTTITATVGSVSGTLTVTSSLVAAVIKAVTMSTRPTFAIAGATTVRFDITGSLGSTLRMDFGDGTSSSSPGGCLPGSCIYFEHTYATAISRTATLTASDGATSQTASTTVTVGDLSGLWVNTIFNPTTNRTETRSLLIVGGGTFTGSYTHPEGNSESMSGTCNSNGTVSLSLTTGSITMRGVDLDSAGVRSNTTIVLTVVGGSANGMALTFTKV